MADELVYTSMPRGLKPGSRGFCVVASTANLSPRTLSVLESLSAYRHLQTPVGGPHPGNPVAWSHFLLPGEGTSILSRVADSGLDYSGRTNKLAHHIVLDHAQRSPHGPAAMLAAASNLMTSWSGDPRILPPRNLQPGRSLSGPCSLWQSVAGDAGWAGELARNSFNQPRTIVISADDNALGLINEAMSLVPPQHRWRIGFTTFDNGLPQDVRCHWRFVIAGSAEHVQIQKNPPPGLIDLTATLGPAPESNEAKMARSGDRSSVAATVSQVAASPPGMARPATGHSSSDRSVSQKVAAFQAQTGQAADDLVLAPLMPQRLPPAAPGSVPVRPKASSNSASTKEPRGIGFVLTLVALTGCLFLVLAGGGVWFAMQRLTSQETANTMTIDRIVEQQEATKPKVIEPIKIEQPAEDETGPLEEEMKQDVASNNDEAPDTVEEQNENVVTNPTVSSENETKPEPTPVEPEPAKEPIQIEAFFWDEKDWIKKDEIHSVTVVKLKEEKLVRGKSYLWNKEQKIFVEIVKQGIPEVTIQKPIFSIEDQTWPETDEFKSCLLLVKNNSNTVLILPSTQTVELKLDARGSVNSTIDKWESLGKTETIEINVPYPKLTGQFDLRVNEDDPLKTWEPKGHGEGDQLAVDCSLKTPLSNNLLDAKTEFQVKVVIQKSLNLSAATIKFALSGRFFDTRYQQFIDDYKKAEEEKKEDAKKKALTKLRQANSYLNERASAWLKSINISKQLPQFLISCQIKPATVEATLTGEATLTENGVDEQVRIVREKPYEFARIQFSVARFPGTWGLTYPQ